MYAIKSSIKAALLIAAVAALLPQAAFAAGQSFDVSAFRKAQAEGKPILVAVHAGWCVSCVRQAGVLAKLESDRAFDGLVRFNVDYDKAGEALKVLKVDRQATLVVFNGRAERGRSSFETDPDAIRALVARAFVAK